MPLRPFEVDDLFRLERLGWYYGGPFSFAPDGQTLAYVVQRPKATATDHKQEYLWGNDRADLWLVELPAGKPVRLTDGERDGAGFWAPCWSPDGRRLALLSTRGGNATLWLWERAGGAFCQLSPRGVYLDETLHLPYAWVDDERLICPLLPAGERPNTMTLEVRAAEIATRAWPKARRGEEVTASVLHSGRPTTEPATPAGELQLLPVHGGDARVVASGPGQEFRLAPGGRRIAFLHAVAAYHPSPDAALTFGRRHRFAVRLVSLAGMSAIAAPATEAQDVLPGSLHWSPDGNALAFLGCGADRALPPQLISVRPDDGAIARFALGPLDPTPPLRAQPALRWAADGGLVVAARPAGDPARRSQPDRRDWCLVREDRDPLLLSAGLDPPPSTLLAEPGRHSFVGLTNGRLWRLHADGRPPSALAAASAPKLTAVTWPAEALAGPPEAQVTVIAEREFSRVLVAAREDQRTDYYQADLATGVLAPVATPAPAATALAYEPRRDTVLFGGADRTGTRLWAQRDGAAHGVLETNTFLAGVAEGEFRRITYRSLDGEELGARCLLPSDYQSGRRYPLVAWVYPGAIARPTASPTDRIFIADALNLQLLAAYGYLVITPSMPLPPVGVAGDPMLALGAGVLPAVERAIELGLADPARLFLMGQSLGGYAVYGLLTQTRRFTAAVALAGIADLISLYGTFDARYRYDEEAHEQIFQPALLEAAEFRMGSLPWKDPSRYVRNSPIFQVDRVQTPLLIIQGDMDYVAIQQGEEFFMGLYRQGKRASFVRYWGEGHVLESPANIRDMWQRILAWFEACAGERTAGAAS